MDLKIKNQGAVIVNKVYIKFQNENVALICIDCRSKYFEDGLFSQSKEAGLSVYLHANERTMHINEELKEEPTVVLLPFGEWTIWSCSTFKSGCYIALTK